MSLSSIHEMSWPLQALGECLEHVARAGGLSPTPLDGTAVAEATTRLSKGDLPRFVDWVGGRLGIETDTVSATPSSVDAVLRGAAPAVLRYQDSDGMRLLLLVGTRAGRVRLLCPDMTVRSSRVAVLRNAITAPYEATVLPDVDHLLTRAAVPERRRAQVRRGMARERLGQTSVATVWALRVPPGASFIRQLRDAGTVRRIATVAALTVAVSACEMLGWIVIGAAALNGRLDLGWLTAWVLLVLTAIPLQALSAWTQSSLTLDVSRLLKSRLLVGALRVDVAEMRRQGVGQLLGRVIESQAFEALVLNSGLSSIVGLLQLGAAAWVLSRGVGGLMHVALLVGWTTVAIGLAAAYLHRLGIWTDVRLDLTHALVERMVGHQTTLVQESPARRDREQDASLSRYWHASRAVDTIAIPFMAGVPTGWTLLGLAGLIPAFISGSATPAALAISVGGILLASRAFGQVGDGLSSAVGAVVAWRQIGGLFTAAAKTEATTPFISTTEMRAGARTGSTVPLMDVDHATYRHPGRETPALRDASLTVRHGDRLLIEGPSGGGKSTFVSMLAGLRTPDAGLLRLNGLDRHTIGDNWHTFATEAPQFHENHLLSGTLGFNLLMGRGWPATDADLDEAAELCDALGLGPLLQQMPAGLMQNVGDAGWQLSHGERSRVFLARALLQDAELTVLDESFAALDPESLETCLSTVLTRARTLAVVAHP